MTTSAATRIAAPQEAHSHGGTSANGATPVSEHSGSGEGGGDDRDAPLSSLRRPGVRALLLEDLRAARDRDPAARSLLEIALLYPGVHALWAHRMAHRIWLRGGLFRFAARLVSEVSRAITGVEIHPGAQIGRRFFVDHGMGVVIGETAEIGNDVMLYHGVTLGGTATKRAKRHPTVEDGVLIGAGATVLGPVTIGADAKIGAGTVVVRDVPAGMVAVGATARIRYANDAEQWTDPAIYI